MLMFKDNLISLRKIKNLSQDELAEKINVSRQTVSKYETGESFPDIEKAAAIAELFDVSLDELVNYDSKKNHFKCPPPKGKHAFGIVKVGDKGQIVIPANARKIFDIKSGDSLLLLGDEEQGLALIKEKDFMKFVSQITNKNQEEE